MVNFINKIIAFFVFIKVSYYLLKFTFILGWSTDTEARILITQVRWRISKIEDGIVRKQFLDFLDKMKKERFKDGQNNI
jgi:hypothetical protein